MSISLFESVTAVVTYYKVIQGRIFVPGTSTQPAIPEELVLHTSQVNDLPSMGDLGDTASLLANGTSIQETGKFLVTEMTSTIA